MNDTNNSVVKQQKVFNNEKLRFAKYAELFKPLMILRKEFKLI